jgi:eukaryotic-like serine/threonine-protein kinase
MSCLGANTIVAFVDGRLSEADRSKVGVHLDSCEACFALVGAVVRQESIGQERSGQPVKPPLSKGVAIGRYLILDLVGRGGMGEVYSAYDPKLNRRVALKLLNERTKSPQSAKRFSREAQAIARLSHPNVVAIYDAGDFGDRLFLAMEFIEGQTLAEWLRSAPWSWREIRDVFAAAGSGLAAAHEAGLVHRDFKPHNVMVGRDGSARVMDFGLATDSSEIEPGDTASFDLAGSGPEPTSHTVALTRTGALLGTPLYMAPEQFLRRPADARTDQFSFCVSLYEAMYGERPFPSGSLSLLLEAVVAGRVREPAQRTRAPSFLRKLLLRGLAAEPASRFSSMPALLEELRYDPVRRRRHIGIGAAVAAMAVAAVLGGQRLSTRGLRMCRGGSDKLAGIWESADGGERRSTIHRAFLSTGRGFAEDTWNRVSALLDDYSRRWKNVYTDACEATHVRGDQSVPVMDLRMACLEGPRGSFRALTDTLLRADPAVLVQAINASHALPALDRCSDVPALQAVVLPPADAATRARVDSLRKDLAEVNALKDTGQLPAARRRAGPLVDSAHAVGYQPLLVETLATSAWLAAESGAVSEAAKIYQQTVWSALAAHRDDIAAESAAALVGINGYHLGRSGEAERWAEVGEALVQRLGPGHDRTASWFYQDRGIARERQGDYRGALSDLDLALSLKKRVLAPNHPDLAATLHTIANVRNDIGDHQSALTAADEAVEIFRNAYGAGSPLIAEMLGSRGETLAFLGRYSEAERDLRLSVDLFTALVGADHPWTAYSMTALGKTLISEHRWGEAMSMLERALRIREKSELNAELVAETRFALAQVRWEAGQDQLGARQLATAARDAYDALPEHGKQAREIDGWLASRSRSATPSP